MSGTCLLLDLLRILEWLLFSKDVAIFILVHINRPYLYETYTVATITANIRPDEIILANNLQGHMSDMVRIVYKSMDGIHPKWVYYKRIELGVRDRRTRNAFKCLVRRE